MAIIKPFRAFRPTKELVTKVAALPYDVMNTEEAKEIVKGNEYSFLHIDKPEMHVLETKNNERYIFAGDTLASMIDRGIFKQDEESLYIYVLKNEYTTQCGLVCLVSANEYDKGIIKKHENTRVDKELDRINHVTYCKAHTGPIFLAYKGLELVTSWLLEYTNNNDSVYSFDAGDGVTHEIFKVSDVNTINNIVSAFDEANALYIADGHHRAAAAAAVARNNKSAGTATEDNQHFLATIFPKEQLYIMDYNRVLKDDSGLTEKEFIEILSEKFIVEKTADATYKPSDRHIFGMRYNKVWYKLTIKSEFVEESDPVNSLDAELLQNNVLEPIFKILDPKSDKRIDFVGGVRGIDELNKRTDEDMDIAFSMYPTSMDELIAVADASKLMPPKSTWFEPKLRSGLFIHTIN